MRYLGNVLIAILLHIGPCLSGKITCKDENDKDVDWYLIYKLPMIEDEPKGSDLKKGTSYAYILAPGSSKWTMSIENVASGSMIEKTLEAYYADKKDLTFLFYNDSPPGSKKKSGAGHQKGVLVFDEKTGFWLIHSVPNFPDRLEYNYPNTAMIYGQVALCVTFKTSELDKIAQQLLYDHPNIYASEITEEVEKQLGEKARSLFFKKPLFVKKEPFTRKAELVSLGGKQFISFAKDNQLHEDLYTDIIAPALNTSLIVETWREGSGGIMGKECKLKNTVVDVKSVNMTLYKGRVKKTVSFQYTKDHSKWSISDNYVCIADLNRMVSQERRGGGALCFESPDVVTAFSSIIANSDECSNKNSKKKNKGK